MVSNVVFISDERFISLASLTKESYSYDNTGNRTGTGLVTDKGSRLLSDSTYRGSAHHNHSCMP